MLIDSHAHLRHKNYQITASDIVKNAVEAGVSHIINVGTSVEANRHVLASVKNFSNVYGSVAVYPHDDMNIPVTELRDALAKQVKLDPKIIAVGECGIDISNWQNGRSVEDQTKLFEMQVQLAIENKLPIIIHNRNGTEQIFEIINRYKNSGLTGVFHCFTQDWEYAKAVLDLGFYISFAGNITYPSNRRYLETVEKIPTDRFLVETDSPYLPPQGHRGEVNEPKYVKIVAEMIAATRKDTFSNIEACSCRNTCSLFKITI